MKHKSLLAFYKFSVTVILTNNIRIRPVSYLSRASGGDPRLEFVVGLVELFVPRKRG